MKPTIDRVVILVLALYVLASFFAGGCRGERDVVISPPMIVSLPDGGDGGIYDEPFDGYGGRYLNPTCAAACARLQGLGCPDGFKRPGEDSCYIVCKRAEATGKIDFKPACVADAGTKDLVRACGTYRCR